LKYHLYFSDPCNINHLHSFVKCSFDQLWH
jgi:hypothetical protein